MLFKKFLFQFHPSAFYFIKFFLSNLVLILLEFFLSFALKKNSSFRIFCFNFSHHFLSFSSFILFFNLIPNNFAFNYFFVNDFVLIIFIFDFLQLFYDWKFCFVIFLCLWRQSWPNPPVLMINLVYVCFFKSFLKIDFCFHFHHLTLTYWALSFVICSDFFFVRLFLSHILDRELLKLSWVCSGFFLSSSICSHFWGDFSNFFRVTRVASFFFFVILQHYICLILLEMMG